MGLISKIQDPIAFLLWCALYASPKNDLLHKVPFEHSMLSRCYDALTDSVFYIFRKCLSARRSCRLFSLFARRSIEQCIGKMKIRSGSHNLYVKIGYKFPFRANNCCNSHDRRADDIGNLHDRRADKFC